MILSRKWLNEFVDCSAWSDHDFSEAMTLSGSKVETFTNLHDSIRNVVAGRIVEMVRHTNSDHMWVCQVDVGGDAPIQIVTGAQNQRVGDLVPVALGRRAAARRQADPRRHAARRGIQRHDVLAQGARPDTA